MTRAFNTFTSSIALIAIIAAAPLQAQTAIAPTAAPAFAVAQASDTTLTCMQLAGEMVTSANMVAAASTKAGTAQSAALAHAQAQVQAQAQAQAQAAATADNRNNNAMAQAINQAQLNNQLGNLQVQAARAGINPGTSGAAIGGLAVLASAVSTPGGAAEGAKQAATGFATQQLASRIPGGAMLGGLVGGMFGKKKKAPPVEAAAPAPAPVADQSAQLVQLGQQRMTFLQSLSASKNCT